MSSPRGRRLVTSVLVLALLAVAALAVAGLYLQQRGIAPRSLAPYLERRSTGHNPAIVGFGTWSAAVLTALDRGAPQPHLLMPMRIGAQPGAAPAVSGANTVMVSDSAAVRLAIKQAQPGDVITLLPGIYRFEETSVAVNRAGSGPAPITLRAAQPDTALVEFDLVEGFVVSAPYWRFENLSIRGVCARHSDCEHAFHVVAGAQHFVAVNNAITDFNAHIKINGSDGRFPDHGLIEGNTLSNSSVRDTANPVTLIDLVSASGWTIRRNLISDFIKGGGNQVSYGAFAKGAGSDNMFEQNIVLCEHRLSRAAAGQRVGLSLGGGGTGQQYCRDQRCITEQDGGVIRANLIASCSDDGIYLNSAARSSILHNTLIDTGGISVRFPASSANVEGNLVDGAIRSRNGGIMRLTDNLATPIALLYLGHHPVRDRFAAPASLDFSWAGEGPRRPPGGAKAPDLCGAARSDDARYGAFEEFSTCLRPLR